MIESITGSKSKEIVLIYIAARKEAYAREIAAFYNVSVTPLQNQLNRLEHGGVLMSRAIGKTRVYSYNTRYAFYKELKALIEKVILFLPDGQKNKLFDIRKRPRRKSKPFNHIETLR